MRILLINPPFYRLQDSTLVHYPQGPAFVAAALEQAGFKAPIFNADFDGSKRSALGNTNHLNPASLYSKVDSYQKRLSSEVDPVWTEIRERLIAHRPQILFISVFNTTLTASLRVAQIAKELDSGVKVVFESLINRGLHSAIDATRELHEKNLDFAIKGEPEITAVELVREIAKGTKDFSSVLGLGWKRADGSIVVNPPRPTNENLDSLPFPARANIEGFERMPPHAFQGILGGRGCPFKCTFCGVPNTTGTRVRLRSAKSLVDEMEQVYHQFGTRYFYMCEDIFFVNRHRVHEFSELLIERKLPLYWSGQTRAEMIDDKTVQLMKRSGGQHISVGVESGSQRSRDIMRKDNTVEDVRRCAKVIKNNGMRMVAFVILGLPWETESEIQQTVDLVKEIDPYIVYPYLATPVKGTELHNVMLNDKAQLADGGWSEARDKFHMNMDHIKRSEGETAHEKAKLAVKELVKRNRFRLISDLPKRPEFYWALIRDLKLERSPMHLYNYVKDLVATT